MIAAGIDLGGTKIEAQLFDATWTCRARHRIDTPRDYEGMVRAMAAQVAWAETEAGAPLPTGIAAAGLVLRATGLAMTANLPATGRPFPTDINAASGRKTHYYNDCRALTLSEAVFGAARGQSPAVGLILGTGIGGGVAVNGRLLEGMNGLAGEFGHFALSGAVVAAHGLPIVPCGCGRPGCTETLIAGPGLSRLARHLTGREVTAPEVTEGRAHDPALARVWAVWCELAAEMLKTLCHTIDPSCIVIGGGLSKAPGLTGDLTAALGRTMLPGFRVPALLLAEGGDASGARGAAYAAWQAEEVGHD